MSLVINWRVIISCLVVVVLALVVAALSITLGDYPLSLSDVLHVFAGAGSAIESTVVFDLRLGRVVVALAAGGALAYSGALTQSVARNPLASPDILGITSGASLAAAATIVFAGAGTSGVITAGATTALSVLGIPGVATVGALVTGVAVWLLAGSARSAMLRMVLIGVGVSIFLSALTTWLLAYADLDRAMEARMWLTGSLNGRDWNHAWPPLVILLVALAMAGWLAFQLAALSLGEVTAHVLGHNVTAAQITQLVTAAVLAAVAVSATGPVPFIAFVAPQIARRVAGTPTPPLVFSALMGAFVLAAADFAARVVIPWELPVGVLTAFIGAPVLLFLIIRTNREA